jgi:hypothetical protein
MSWTDERVETLKKLRKRARNRAIAGLVRVATRVRSSEFLCDDSLYLRINATNSFKSCSGGAGFLNAEAEG